MLPSIVRFAWVTAAAPAAAAKADFQIIFFEKQANFSALPIFHILNKKMKNEEKFRNTIIEQIEADYFDIHRGDLMSSMAVIDVDICIGDCCSSSCSSSSGG